MADEEKVMVTFVWTDLDTDHKANCAELILAIAKDVNYDIFETYLDGTEVKENSPFQIYQLNPCTSGKFEKAVNLQPGTYQFVFRVAYSDKESKIDVSEDHFQTILASGRTINYIECEPNKIQNQGKTDFGDICEDTPLMNPQKQTKETKNGCGCGPNRCCLL